MKTEYYRITAYHAPEGLSTAEIYPVLNGSNLICSAILANILFKEKIAKKSIIGMALAFVGTVLINLF